MSTVLNPYLRLPGTAREAMTFYQHALGGDLQVSTFKDFGASQDPSQDDLVMHSRLMSRSGFVLMAADTTDGMAHTPGDTVSVSLGGEERAELQGYWDALSEGAEIVVPLSASPWGDSFGTLRDRFGVLWFVNIAASAT